jgi:hypothetical protein
MTIIIPNTFADKTGVVQLEDLDENFTSVVSGVNTEVTNIQGQVDTIEQTVNNIEDPVAMGLVFGPDPVPAIEPGTVVQTLQGIKKDTWGQAGQPTTFYQVTGLSVTITPKFATSKILVSLMIHIGSGYWEIQGRITRDGVAIDDSLGTQRGTRSRCTFLDNRYEAAGSVRNGWGSIHAQYLDSPNTTSAITYGVQLNGYSTFTIGVNYNPYSDPDQTDYFGTPISTITVMEIAQ